MIAEVAEDAARPGPPLVYVPGIDGTGELLLGTAGRLAGRFRLIRLRYRVDPGAPEPGGDPYGELAASVGARLDERAVGRTLLLAESFGVAVALRTALERPELVAGLALVNGFARYGRRSRLLVSSIGARALPPALFRLGRRVFSPLLFGARRDREALRAFRRVAGSRLDAGYRQRLVMLRRLDLSARLGEVRQPVAIFASDRDSIVDSVRAGRSMAERLPDATLEILHGGGHLVLPLSREPWVERLTALARRAGLAPASPGPVAPRQPS